MKLSRMTAEGKAKVLGSVGMALKEFLGNDNLYFLLIVDDAGHMADVKNINRSAIPRLLREYADQVEKKAANGR